jgi:hypothetical protein
LLAAPARTEQPPLAAVEAGSYAEFLTERRRLMAAVIRDSY